MSNACVSKSVNSWHNIRHLVKPYKVLLVMMRRCCRYWFSTVLLSVMDRYTAVRNRGSVTSTQARITVTVAIRLSCTVEAVSNNEYERHVEPAVMSWGCASLQRPVRQIHPKVQQLSSLCSHIHPNMRTYWVCRCTKQDNLLIKAYCTCNKSLWFRSIKYILNWKMEIV